MNPAIFLAEMTALYTLWQAFPDGPLAFHSMLGLWVAWRCVLLGYERRGDWWPACLFGAGLGFMQSGCALMYVGNGRSFVCDAGTGLPITALIWATAAGLAAYYARRLRDRSTTRH